MDKNCILSQKGLDSSGHTNIVISGKSQAYHRYLWEQENGRLDRAYILHHKCHNTNCIEVSHLTPMLRALHSSMHNTGEGNPNAKLTADQVYKIKYLWKYDRENWTYRKLMALFPGVSKGCINFIVNGKTWQHIVVD